MTGSVRVLLAMLSFALPIGALAAKDGDPSLPDLVASLDPSVVTIDVDRDGDGRADAQGTGWFRDSGEVVTNRHVVAKGVRARVRFADGRTSAVKGVLADDPKRDLVVLAVSVDPAPKPIPQSTRQPRAGERVFIIGTPLGLERTVSEGIISSIRSANGITVIQTTAAISPGSSGSPVMNMDGQVLGVATAQREGGQLLNFAVSVDAVAALKSGALRDLAQWSGSIEVKPTEMPAELGMTEIEQSLAAFYGVPPNPSVLKMKPKEYDDRMKQVHPSFVPTYDDLQQGIKYGATQSKRDYSKVFSKYSRKVGDDQVTAYFPAQSAVFSGWSHAREYKPIPDAKSLFPIPGHHLRFFIQMSRKNRPKELIAPKFVLQLGKDVYLQPAAEPKADDLQSKTYTSSGVRSYYNYFTKRTEYYTYSDRDTYYSTAYTVVFDLLNKDGAPAIKPQDKEVTLILVLQGEEKKVEFKLDDWSIEAATEGKR